MSRIASVLIVLFSLVGHCVSAQQQPKPAAAKPAAPKKLLMPQAYLGTSDYKGGPIKKDELRDLLKQGLTSRDSVGNRYKVARFELGYAERMIYEDSLGSLVSLMDYMSENFFGDTLSSGISSSIFERFKAGDTLYINKVIVLKPSGANTTEIAGKGMKCVLMK